MIVLFKIFKSQLWLEWSSFFCPWLHFTVCCFCLSSLNSLLLFFQCSVFPWSSSASFSLHTCLGSVKLARPFYLCCSPVCFPCTPAQHLLHQPFPCFQCYPFITPPVCLRLTPPAPQPQISSVYIDVESVVQSLLTYLLSFCDPVVFPWSCSSCLS